MEIWKSIPEDPMYEVSNFGRVKSPNQTVIGGRTMSERRLKGRILKQSIDTHGYRYVRFRMGGRTYRVHRLIAVAFIPNPKNKPHINHINGKPGDNSIKNLEWVTCSENHFHCTRVLKKRVGSKCSWAKLNESKVRKIRALRAKGVATADIAKMFGVCSGTIYFAAKGRNWAAVKT